MMRDAGDPADPVRERAPGVSAWLLARLARRTTTGRFIAEVDGLRFVSIALVLAYHLFGYVAATAQRAFTVAPAEDWLGRLAEHGHYGVQLFFMISGFVLGLPFAAHRLAGGPRVRLGRYLVRRLTRLEPPYVVAMVGLFAAMVLVQGADARALAPHLAASLAYVHNAVYLDGSVINPVAWSLEVEVQFYLLAPLLALALYRARAPLLRRGGLAALSAVAVALQVAGATDAPLLERTLAAHAQFFLLGMLMAELHVTRWTAPSARPRAWDALWLACWPLLVAAWNAPAPVDAFAFPVVAAALFAASLRGRLSRAVLGNAWIATIGGMCYTIYLLHYPLIGILGPAVSSIRVGDAFWVTALLQSALLLPPILLICALYFAAIERPCMRPDWPARLRDRLARLGSPRPSVPPAKPAVLAEPPIPGAP